MRRRTINSALAVVAGGIAACALLRVSAVSTRFSAAARAFGDPALVKSAPGHLDSGSLDAQSCAKLIGESLDQSARIEAAIANEFASDDDGLGELDTALVRSLTLPGFGVTVTRKTLKYVRFFAKTEPGRRIFTERRARATRYRGLIVSSLREAGLPEDLQWLVAIESGFDARAVSPAGAAGLFQFMPQTGAIYGLEQNEWVDERRSLKRAPLAGAAHLRDLYERLGDWELALAAYNAGYATVVEAMARVVREKHVKPSQVRFTDLAEAGVLPDETQTYVPRIVAFAIVALNRAKFGLDEPALAAARDSEADAAGAAKPGAARVGPEGSLAGAVKRASNPSNPQMPSKSAPATKKPAPNGPDAKVAKGAERPGINPAILDDDAFDPLADEGFDVRPFDLAELPVPAGTKLITVAKSADVPLDVVRDYNPQLLSDRAPPDGADYIVYVPADTLARALAAFPVHYEQEVAARGPDSVGPSALPPRGPSLPHNRLPVLGAAAAGVPGSHGAASSAAPTLGGVVGDGASASDERAPSAVASGLGGVAAACPQPGRDPLGIFAPRGLFTAAAKPALGARDISAHVNLDFLGATGAESSDARLANGITVRFERLAGAREATLEIKLAHDATGSLAARLESKDGPCDGPPGSAPAAARCDVRGLSERSELTHVVRVARGDLDVGALVAAAQVRQWLAEGNPDHQALGRAGAQSKLARSREVPTPAWDALSRALFPKGHLLSGLELGRALTLEPTALAAQAFYVADERRASNVTVTVRGDLDARTRGVITQAFEAFDASMPAAAQPVGVHPRDERVVLEATPGASRALVGWVWPSEGVALEAAQRVAAELLAGGASPWVSAIFDDVHDEAANAASSRRAHASYERHGVAGVLTVALTGKDPADLASALATVDAAFARLAREGAPEAVVGAARVRAASALERDLKLAAAPPPMSGRKLSPEAFEVWRDPARARKLRLEIDKISVASVKDVAARLLSPTHRAVVSLAPRSAGSSAQATLAPIEAPADR